MKIGINIWDDFYDDDYVPKDKIQETFAYIEGDIPEGFSKNVIIQIVYDHLMTVEGMGGVTILKNGDRILFKHLTHNRLGRLLKELQDAKLTINEIPIIFYSES